MKNRNKKRYIFFNLLLIVGISIGYAVLSTTLSITGKSTIEKSSWNVRFENINVTYGSVTPTVEPIITNNTTISNFELILDKPGDFYEFTVDVVNDGSIDAMIDSLEKILDLTEEQKKYLNYIVEYQNGEEIAIKQLVKKEDFVRLKVRVEYKNDITAFDLPANDEVLILGLTLNYVQADERGILVKNHGIVGVNGDINEIGTIVTIGDQQFYTIGTEENNVKLLSMYNLYVGNIVNEDKVAIPLTNPTGKQSSKAKGVLISSYFEYTFPWVGATAFSSEEVHGESYNSYEGSIVEGYVNDYKEILEGEEYGIPVVEARLIRYDELINSETFACHKKNGCSNKYPWIYLTSYWSGSAFSTSEVWFVISNGQFGARSYDSDDALGVRPVIIISKSLF